MGHPQGHVGVGGEVAVDLEGKGHRRPHHLHRTEGLRRGENGVDQHRQPVGQHHFFKRPPQKAHQSLPELVPVKGVGLPELGGQLRRPADGAGHHLGEEGEKQGMEQKTPLDLRLAPPHIDHIAHGLEEIEGDAHRQHNVQHRCVPGNPHPLEEPRRQGDGKVNIFKEEEEHHVGQQAEDQHPPLFLPAQGDPRPIGGEDHKEQQGEIDWLGA